MTKISSVALHGIGGVFNITHNGDLQHFGKALYHPNGKYNLLSQRQLLKEGFTIHFNNKDNQYEIQHPIHPSVTFTCNKEGLYTIPISSAISVYCQPAQAYLTIKNKQITQREKDILKRAYHLHHQLAHMSDAKILKLLQHNGIIDCPVTVGQYTMMRNLMGPCLHCMRGKQTHNHQHSITIDDHYPTKDKEDVIFADIFYLKGSTLKEPYLLTILAKTKHITITYLGTKTSKNIYTAFDNILDYYKIHQWKITHIITDHEANFTANVKQL
jgi:hypothetical protein